MIPDSWDVKPLRDISTISSGGTPSRTRADYWNGDIPWITTSEVDFSRIEFAEQFISNEGLQNSAAKLFPPGTLLLALYGQGKTRGKVGVLGIAAATNQACAAIEIKRDVSPDSLLHFLTSRYDAIRGMSNGGSQDNLNSGIVKSILVPVPSSAEQRAIAAALSDIDALIAGLEKLIAKKRDLKQAAMQQLLTGQTRLPGFSGEWVVKALGDIADLYQPETISQTSFTDHGYPVFGANGVVGMYSRFNHSTPQVTISCRGNCGTVNRTRGPAWITGNAMVVNLDGAEGVDKSYVYHALNYSDLSVLVTGSGIPQIVREPLSKFVINIPADIQEQSAIGSFLSDLDDEIALVEVRLNKTRDLKQGMMQELLTGRTRLV